MGVRHREWPVEGVQFHPEAILTEHGHALLRNFLAGAAVRRRLQMAMLAAAMLYPAAAAAGALAQCQAAAREFDAVARCLTALDLEILTALQQAERRAGAAARDFDERAKRGNTGYAALAQSSRAFALYQGAQCEYVHAMTPGSNVRPKAAGPAAADLARIACRIDLARQRIEELGN